MNSVQRIAKNSGVMISSQIANYVFGFFDVMDTAHYLGRRGSVSCQLRSHLWEGKFQEIRRIWLDQRTT